MHWQEFAAFAIVGITAALFVRGLMRRSPAACGRDCSCPPVASQGRAEGGPAPHHRKDLSGNTRA